jgi:hypothetical protein
LLAENFRSYQKLVTTNMSKEDMLEALQAIADYFDAKSDVDFNDHFYVPNTEMKLQQLVKQMVRRLGRRLEVGSRGLFVRPFRAFPAISAVRSR